MSALELPELGGPGELTELWRQIGRLVFSEANGEGNGTDVGGCQGWGNLTRGGWRRGGNSERKIGLLPPMLVHTE